MKRREDARRAIRNAAFDVCVIGGGATGAGCALDAQLRGFSTVLLEAKDFASQTSSASTKLAHGGVRYLQQAMAELDEGQFALVKKALAERLHMLQCAPHLAHPLELLVPCGSAWEVAYFGMGLKVYDWIARSASLFPSEVLSRAEAMRRMPSLRGERLAGAVSYADGQFDDARFGLALAQTFAEQGGELLNYARVTGFGRSAEGKLGSVEVEDTLSGEKFEVRAKLFVNCTGPFADSVRRIANPALEPRLRLSRGVHVLLPLEVLRSMSALLIPKTEDGRVIFAIPWLGRLLVGTTDDEAQAADEMVVTREEVEFLLKYVKQYLRVNVGPEDVVSAFAGVRPLLKSREAVDTKKLIRDHEVEVDKVSGLISVLGGKWTTYRAMAEDGIDHVERRLGRRARCGTRGFLLAGAKGYSADYWEELAARRGVSRETAQHLALKYGTDAERVLDLADADPVLMGTLGGAAIKAEVVYAVREEMAQTLEDVLLRRIGLQLYGWKQAEEAAPVVGELMARELGWDEATRDCKVAEYLNSLRGWRQSMGVDGSARLNVD